MNQSTDQQLLRDYAEHRSESAFTELVRRHIDFVYSAALRMVRDGHLAGDVTQGVFVALANTTGQVADCPALEGWLHGTTRNLAANAVRAEVRRRNREQEAAIMNEILSPGDDENWEHIAPHLDEALGELSPPDRDALLLRYFKNYDFRAVGLALGVSDDTAQKRVSRAVEKLREFFSKRKITIGTGSLGVLITANAVQSAPVGLGATVLVAAFTGSTATSSTVIATATKTIVMTTLQKTLVTVTVAVLAGAGIFEVKQAHDAHAEAQKFQEQQSPLAGQIKQLQNNFADATNRLADLLAENLRLKSNQHEMELLKLRGETGMLRQQNELLAQALQNSEKQDHPTFPTNFVSRDSLAFAGYDTPEHALKSGLWAKSVGNEKVWRDLTAPEMTNLLNSYVQGNTDEERSQFLVEKTKDLVGYKVLSETPVAPDEVLMQMEYDWQANGQTGNAVSMEVMKQIDGEWKVYDEYANSDQVAELLNALNSKNSTEANSANANPPSAGPVRVIGQ